MNNPYSNSCRSWLLPLALALALAGCLLDNSLCYRGDASRDRRYTLRVRNALLKGGFAHRRGESLKITDLIYSWCWYEGTEHDGPSQQESYRFVSCDDLATISKYYVDTLYRLGWRRSRSYPPSGQPEWCGEFTNAVGHHFFVRVNGPWSVGVVSRNGVVAVDEGMFIEHPIVMEVTGAEPESVLGRDFRRKVLTVDELGNHLVASTTQGQTCIMYFEY